MEQTMTTAKVLENLFISWIGNYIGCLFFAYLLHKSELFNHHDDYLILATEDKLSLKWEVVFIRGLFANVCVGIATWLQSAALDMPGKIMGIFLPIFTFAALGFEHSIANQFIISLGCMQGAQCSVEDIFVRNLIPSTLGNWAGGVFLVALPFTALFGDNEFTFLRPKAINSMVQAGQTVSYKKQNDTEEEETEKSLPLVTIVGK